MSGRNEGRIIVKKNIKRIILIAAGIILALIVLVYGYLFFTA